MSKRGMEIPSSMMMLLMLLLVVCHQQGVVATASIVPDRNECRRHASKSKRSGMVVDA
jgi:hypothetical protein